MKSNVLKGMALVAALGVGYALPHKTETVDVTSRIEQLALEAHSRSFVEEPVEPSRVGYANWAHEEVPQSSPYFVPACDDMSSRGYKYDMDAYEDAKSLDRTLAILNNPKKLALYAPEKPVEKPSEIGIGLGYKSNFQRRLEQRRGY